MTEEDRRENSARLKAVEEAVIEFRVIAEKVVVMHAKRLDEHDKAIEEIRASIYLSCDAKTQEVDTKIAKNEQGIIDMMEASEIRMLDMINKHFIYAVYAFAGVISALGVLCTIAMMWVSYSNSQIADLGDKMNIRENVSVKNGENIKATQEDVGHLRQEIQDVKHDVHEILNRMIK